MIRILMALALLVPMPAEAIVVVNAASIVRAKCKRIPPERRSPRCKRLVGG